MVKISYTRIKNIFFRESEKKTSRIVLFNSEIGRRELQTL